MVRPRPTKPPRARNVPPPRDARAIARRLVWAGVIGTEDPREFTAAVRALEANPELFGLLNKLEVDNDLISEVKSREGQIKSLVQEQLALL